MKALSEKDSEANFRYWGGDHMKSVGGDLVTHYNQLAVMGFWEVFRNIPRISSLISTCKKDILNYNPDVIILIDFAGFNLRIAKFAFQHNFKVFYYISPKIWAWNTSRALKIKKYVDRMFVILPFEKDFYSKFKWDVDYIGNPVVESVKNFTSSEGFIDKIKIIKSPIVAALPGSRTQEIKTIMPVFSEVIKAMDNHHFLVAQVNSVPESLYETLHDLPNVSLVKEESYNVLTVAQMAMVTSGTATLETALFNVPQVVVYKTGFISYQIAKSLIKVPFISLVNLIAGRQVVKELIQYDCTASNIRAELEKLENDNYQQKVLAGYEEIRGKLGEGNAAVNAATLMINYLSKSIQ